jgi:hypothetical protein
VIANFCTRAILLERGRKIVDAAPLEVVSAYKMLQFNLEAQAVTRVRTQPVAPESACDGQEGLALRDFAFEEAVGVEGEPLGIFRARVVAARAVEEPVVNFGIRNHGTSRAL